MFEVLLGILMHVEIFQNSSKIPKWKEFFQKSQSRTKQMQPNSENSFKRCLKSLSEPKKNSKIAKNPSDVHVIHRSGGRLVEHAVVRQLALAIHLGSVVGFRKSTRSIVRSISIDQSIVRSIVRST